MSAPYSWNRMTPAGIPNRMNDSAGRLTEAINSGPPSPVKAEPQPRQVDREMEYLTAVVESNARLLAELRSRLARIINPAPRAVAGCVEANPGQLTPLADDLASLSARITTNNIALQDLLESLEI